MTSRTRLSFDERRKQLRLEAEKQLLTSRTLPLNMSELAGQLGVSKPLIYRYFPDQRDMMDHILQVRLGELLQSVRHAGSQANDPLDGFLRITLAYFEQVAEIGPVVRFILREPFMKNALSKDTYDLLDQLSADGIFRLSSKTGTEGDEVSIAYYLLIAITEETGTHVWQGKLDHELGRSICRELIEAAAIKLSETAAS